MTSSVGRASRVLEVGCGTGNYIIALEEACGCSCWGEDPSEQMLAKAQERATRLSFRVGRAETLDFPAGFFDLVFSVDVVHHLSDRPRHFREVWRVLKSGGKLCSVTDSEWIIRHRVPLALYFPDTVEADLRRYPAPAELRALMEQVGLAAITESVVQFSYLLTDIQAYWNKAFSCLRLISEDAFHRGMERMEHDLRDGPIPCVSRYLLLWGTKERPDG